MHVHAPLLITHTMFVSSGKSYNIKLNILWYTSVCVYIYFLFHLMSLCFNNLIKAKFWLQFSWRVIKEPFLPRGLPRPEGISTWPAMKVNIRLQDDINDIFKFIEHIFNSLLLLLLLIFCFVLFCSSSTTPSKNWLQCWTCKLCLYENSEDGICSIRVLFIILTLLFFIYKIIFDFL